MARRALLERVPLPAERVHRMRGELPDLVKAAEAYAAEIGRSFTGSTLRDCAAAVSIRPRSISSAGLTG
jgi:hypothetical protein